MSVIETARRVMAETKASGALLRHEPYPLNAMLTPWEAPAQWRIGPEAWVMLKAEAKDIAGADVEIADDVAVTLFGYPIVVDPGMVLSMVLEPVP